MADATDQEIDKVREIAGETSYARVAVWIKALTEGQWERALELIDAWDNEYPAGESIGIHGEGVELNPHIDAGLDIRNRMRLLLGQPELRSSALTGQSGSAVLRNEFVF